MRQPPGVPARRGALKLLDAVLRRGETLDAAERTALRGVDAPADRALARAISGEVLRWLVDLDALIDGATKQRLPDDSKPRMVLRMMLAQWLRLATPPHAIVATCLPLLDGGPRRLAHGVFSALHKRGVTLPPVPTLPADVAARWGERAAAIAGGLAQPPPLDLTVTPPRDAKLWAERLGGISLAGGHVRLPRGQAVEALPGYADGAWWVQDLAAGYPAALIGYSNGKRALDLCAAPGGKTLILASEGWDVTALDISDKRLDRLRENLARTGLSAKIWIADALTWEPAEPFDAILLDAPCTATGTCRRHPDVIHRIGPRQIAEMAELQAKLLDRAQRWLKPGGVLVYAVCSLEREEGEEQAKRVRLDPLPILREEVISGLEITPEGWLRTDPGMLAEHGGLDGFFVARWRA